jgi:hypothetical protein
MILVAVDDFLFRSKIRTTAKLAGVEVAFATSADELLQQARSLNPSMGFVSHVDAARIQAARAAGADDVMARSAFAGQLADILLTARTVKP